MLIVEVVPYGKLPQEEQDEYYDGEYGTYLVVTHNGKLLYTRSGRMEPEDASFGRDLAWVPKAIRQAYDLGYEDGKDMQERIDRVIHGE